MHKSDLFRTNVKSVVPLYCLPDTQHAGASRVLPLAWYARYSDHSQAPAGLCVGWRSDQIVHPRFRSTTSPTCPRAVSMRFSLFKRIDQLSLMRCGRHSRTPRSPSDYLRESIGSRNSTSTDGLSHVNCIKRCCHGATGKYLTLRLPLSLSRDSRPTDFLHARV